MSCNCNKSLSLNFVLKGPTSEVTGSEFTIPIQYKTLNNNIVLQFPLFNFTTVSNGQILKSKLPCELLPKCDQTFKCSTNDALLLSFTFDNAPIFPTADVAYFTVKIKKSGELTISSDTDSVISAGPHTFNSQSIQYESKYKNCDCQKSKDSTIVNTITVLDANAYPITGTDFNVNLTTKQYKDIVVLQIPSFSFTITDIIDPDDPNYPFYDFFLGGQLHSTGGYLPDKIRPNLTQTVITSDAQFNVSVDVYGALRVNSPTNVGSVLYPQTYTLPSTSITYLIEPNKDLTIPNTIIGPGFTNINNLNSALWDGSLRDSHTNDFYDNTFIFGWLDNSNITPDEDPTSTMFFYVRTGKICNGKLELNPIINLSSTLVNANNPGFLANFDTSTAINRTNPLNMIASQTILNVNNVLEGNVYISTTTDGGLIWSNPFYCFHLQEVLTQED